MTKTEIKQLYKSLLKEDMKNSKETIENSEIPKDVQKAPFSDEKKFLDKIMKMSNLEILKTYDSIISEYLNIQSVLGDLSNGIYPSLINFKYYTSHRHEDANVFAESFINDIKHQYDERFDRYKSELKKKISKFLMDQKNLLDILFSPPRNNKKEYINLINELIENHKLMNKSKNDNEEPMFGGLIPLSVMKDVCFDEIKCTGKLSSEFILEMSKSLKNITKKKLAAKILAKKPTFNSIIQESQENKIIRSSNKTLRYILEIVKSNPAIRELAEKLGRSGGDNSKNKKKIKASQNTWTEKSAYKGQIIGLKLSDNISSVINSELALYKSPATKKLFMQKYSQKQLLSYSYKLKQKNPNITEKGKKEVPPSSKGPILVCVDTSSSMTHSLNIVKSLVLYLANIVRKEKRRCYILSFDCDYDIYDIGYNNKKSHHKKLQHFLKIQANGETDATLALEKALSLLSENNWKEADVLTISDFEMHNLSSKLEANIKTQQSKNTKFYGLLMQNDAYNYSANRNVWKLFDENYFLKDWVKLEKLHF